MNPSNEELDALMAWEDAMKFGQDFGECGICGCNLDEAQREHGLCDPHIDEWCELSGEEWTVVIVEIR